MAEDQLNFSICQWAAVVFTNRSESRREGVGEKSEMVVYGRMQGGENKIGATEG